MATNHSSLQYEYWIWIININRHFSSPSRQFTTRTRISSCLVQCWTPPWLTKSKLKLEASSSINLPAGWPTSQSVSRCLSATRATHWTANCRTWLVRTRKVREREAMITGVDMSKYFRRGESEGHLAQHDSSHQTALPWSPLLFPPYLGWQGDIILIWSITKTSKTIQGN